MIREPEKGWFVLIDLCRALGIKNNREYSGRLRKIFGEDHVKLIKVADTRGRMQLMNCIPQRIVNYVRSRRIITPKAGYVYGFVLHTPFNGQKTVKIGRTVDWERRKYQYTCGNYPKHIFLMKKVDDNIKAEKKLLKFARESPHFTLILDFGREWFETDLSDSALDRLFSFLV